MNAMKTGTIGVLAVLLGATLAAAQVPLTAGYNLDLSPTSFDVPFGTDSWSVTAGLIFHPDAPPMTKRFLSPRQVTGAPILLDAQQPFPQRIDEEWGLIVGASQPVSDWHEIILTPGWEWQMITAAPLITRNGAPWPYTWLPTSGPTRIEVEFDPIFPGEVLDIHKALLWVGTPGNRIWGDGVDDSGASIDESGIVVLEYPTPEPATAALLALGGAFTLIRSRRRA